ncbi:MAG: anthranilate synthase component I, partial [Armatimonadota bacterium]
MSSPASEAEAGSDRPARWVPVCRTILADTETPVTAYWKLAHDQALSFLLESVTGGEQVGRYSLIGTGPFETLRLKDHPDPLTALRQRLAEFVVEPGLEPDHFIGGALGVLAYDLVRTIERLPGGPVDDLDLPDLAMLLVDAVVVFDHAKNVQRIVVLTREGDEAAGEARIAEITARLRAPLPPLPSGEFAVTDP